LRSVSMKFSQLRLAFLVVLALFAFGCNGKNVAIVNADMVYKDSAMSEKGTEYLKKISEEMQADFMSAQERVEKASAKEKAKIQAEMQTKLMELQQRLNAEQQQVITAMTEAMKTAMDNVRVKMKLDIIIPSEASLSHDPQIDVTQKVIEEMNAIPIEFTPILPEKPMDQTPEQPAK
ncbi:OmpH family outer membrane protein, partial [Desulfovibrio sp. OttesenSCG-928-O18]|nr:OmpH family outer membrane protein [Desulfovibrio sp. OttesenSCG-928-O18]